MKLLASLIVVLALICAVPALAADNPANNTLAKEPVNGESSFTFVHLTDPHIGYFYVTDPHDMVKGIERFTGALQDIKSYSPDFILNTGDLVEYDSPDFFNAYTELLQSFYIPVYHTPGNHDRRNLFAQGNNLTDINSDIIEHLV